MVRLPCFYLLTIGRFFDIIINMKKVEILSPVGNFESLKCAVNNGADAVYLGVSDFNARNNLVNFSMDELKETVNFAHLFGVKVYLTLNILFKDDELENVLMVVSKALDAKVDAFIVQDIGLVYLLRTIYPNIVLHASTQMGVENLEGVRFLKRLGFSRVVLARETPLSEIKRIKDNEDIEIEYFVQGALCVAYSGNCYLCSLLADSSGNRGKCKQFCRLPYALTSSKVKKEGYLLSAKDFCLLPNLKELVDAGVTSLKIEGRARRPGYVGEATYIYKNAVLNDFKYTQNDLINLKKEFNRGDYISGYFYDDKIIYDKAQNHIGVQIGKVVKTNSGKKFNEIFIESKEEINKNDGLKFFENEKEIASVGVQDVQKIKGNLYKITTTAKVSRNCVVRKILDATLENEILLRKRKLKVDAKFFAKVGERAKLVLKCGDVQICAYGEESLVLAENQPLTFGEAKRQISKLGEDFYLENFDAEIENVFMRKAVLNEIRRQAQDKLKTEILNINNSIYSKNMQKSGKNIEIFEKNHKKTTIFASNSLKELEKYTKENQKLIYKFENFNAFEIKSFCKKFPDCLLYLDMPVLISKQDYDVTKLLLNEISNLGIVANNYYALEMTDRNKTIVGVNMNVYNSYAVKFYVDNGFKDIIMTQERIDFESIKNSGANLFMLEEYYPEYMFFKHCPIKEHLGGNCLNCLFEKGVKYRLNNKSFEIVRKKICSCQFILKDTKKAYNKISSKFSNVIEL